MRRLRYERSFQSLKRPHDMADNAFFEEAKQASVIKAEIVSKYFFAWSNVIGAATNSRSPNIAYIDLFAGPGRYRDDKKSTPLKVLEEAVNNPKIHNRLVSIFNDKDEDNSKSLENAIKGIPGIEKLKHKPSVWNQEVGTEIVKLFKSMSLVPTFIFVDPWGYKGLSLELVNSVIKDWACECVFFFNYNRIRMGLNNDLVKKHMDALFGIGNAAELRAELEKSKSPTESEATVLEYMVKSLNPDGKRFVLPFRFRDDKGTRTSHHLIHVSKHFLGYDIMKSIMHKNSSENSDGVASFEYNPATERQPILFGYTKPLSTLRKSLLAEYAGQKIQFSNLYEDHSVETPFVKKNYKDVLLKLEGSKIIKVETTKAHRPPGTFADHLFITFPKG